MLNTYHTNLTHLVCNYSHLNPTPISFHQPPATSKYSHAAKSLLSTVDFSVEDIKKWAILDSGATSHFLLADAPATNISPTKSPLIAALPNGTHIRSTHTCTLDLPTLPRESREAHIMPGLAQHSLVSIVKLCNAGCEVQFTKIGCIIKYHGRTIFCGRKCTKTGLWMIPLMINQTA